jgi:hypothetical protein
VAQFAISAATSRTINASRIALVDLTVHQLIHDLVDVEAARALTSFSWNSTYQN